MQTRLAEFIRDTPEGREADDILRKCVHCGFCTATCPTYQLLGNELDSPRGRIYLIKELLEGNPVTTRTQLHLDRCLTCRACETTCPSGVRYGRLVDIGRELTERQVSRSPLSSLLRLSLRKILPYPKRFGPLLAIGQALRALMPAPLQAKIPSKHQAGSWPEARHARRMLVLDGCVQPAIAPDINLHAARVLDRLGISLLRVAGAGCCGAVSYHLSAQAEGLDFMRRNIDAWWPCLERGAEAIIITASGCGAMVKDYAEALAQDPHYRDKAARVSALARDPCEVIATEDLQYLARGNGRAIAYHSPCSLQHGQKLAGRVESLLSDAGYRLRPVADAHLCCGSAGTYSILQRELSQRLLKNKISALEHGAPELIATGNIGCLAQLESATDRRVVHWIELLDTPLEAIASHGHLPQEHPSPTGS